MNSDGLFPQRVAVRLFVKGVLRVADYLDLDASDIDALALKHALAVAGQPFMVEVEFLDEEDPLQRFLRFGSDPAGMVAPIAIDLTTPYPD